MNNLIEQRNIYIGIEFGLTRIKAVMTDAVTAVFWQAAAKIGETSSKTVCGFTLPIKYIVD